MRVYTIIVFLVASTACREDAIEGASGQRQTVGGQGSTQAMGQGSQGNVSPPSQVQPGAQGTPSQISEPKQQTTPQTIAAGKPNQDGMANKAIGENNQPNKTQANKRNQEPSSTVKAIENGSATDKTSLQEPKNDTPQEKAPTLSKPEPVVEIETDERVDSVNDQPTYRIELNISQMNAQPESRLSHRLKKAAYKKGLEFAQTKGFTRLKGHKILNQRCEEDFCSGRVQLSFIR